MAVKLVNRAKMTVSAVASSGTGALTLGSAVAGYQTLAAAGVADGDSVRYVIEEGSAWEIGTGTYTATGTTLSRTLVESSTGSLLVATTAAEVYVTAAAADFADLIETASINPQTGTTYTLALTDRGQVVTIANAAANTITVPANATVAFDTGSVVTVIQKGAGATTITGATGVTVNGTSAGSVSISAQYQGVSLLKVAADEWIASGAI